MYVIVLVDSLPPWRQQRLYARVWDSYKVGRLAGLMIRIIHPAHRLILGRRAKAGGLRSPGLYNRIYSPLKRGVVNPHVVSHQYILYPEVGLAVLDLPNGLTVGAAAGLGRVGLYVEPMPVLIPAAPCCGITCAVTLGVACGTAIDVAVFCLLPKMLPL